MGVSRTSCREAMAVLRVRGIIETRQGNGSVIRAIPEAEDGLLTCVDILRREPFDPFEVLLVREMIEPTAIGMAAESATESQLSGIEAEIAEMRRASASNDSEGCILHNSRFHYKTMCATNNDVLVAVVQPLYYGITENTEEQGLWRKMLLKKYHCSTGKCKSCLCIHSGIVEALKKHNVQEAKEKLTWHFVDMRKELLDP